MGKVSGGYLPMSKGKRLKEDGEQRRTLIACLF